MIPHQISQDVVVALCILALFNNLKNKGQRSEEIRKVGVCVCVCVFVCVFVCVCVCASDLDTTTAANALNIIH